MPPRTRRCLPLLLACALGASVLAARAEDLPAAPVTRAPPDEAVAAADAPAPAAAPDAVPRADGDTVSTGPVAANPEPAAAVPATAAPGPWGLQDFGGYLVVIDGVPWGGAFTPPVSRVNLANVERVEVQGGPTPVLYGAPSLAGIVRVSRYAPDATPAVAHASLGSYGSGSAGASATLPSLGAIAQSLSVDLGRDNLRGADQGVTDAHGLYRAATPLGGGRLRADVDYETETRLPESPVTRAGSALLDTPLDANYQPADARIGAHRTQLRMAYAHDTPLGPLDVVAAYAIGRVADRRGFLIVPPFDDGYSWNALGFNQERYLRSLYVDAHGRSVYSASLALGWGADWSGGAASQQSQDFAYHAPLAGDRRAQPSNTVPVLGVTGFSDRRSNTGAYAQLDWTPGARLTASLAARLSHDDETRRTTASEGFAGPAPLDDTEHNRYTRMNAGATLGYHLGGDVERHTGGVQTRLTYRNTGQPAVPDFGPDYRPTLLKPMTGSRIEAGAKGSAARARIDWDLSASYTDVGHLVVAQTDPQGNPVLTNAGAAHVKALDLDTRFQPDPERALALSASAGLHKAAFGTTRTLENGAPTDLVGHDFSLAPRRVAALSVSYEPPNGAYAGVSANYTGRRFLDRLNTAPVGGYVTLDARAGYRTGQAGVVLRAANLTNRRDAIAESEFGDQAFYRAPARTVSLEVYVAWR